MYWSRIKTMWWWCFVQHGRDFEIVCEFVLSKWKPLKMDYKEMFINKKKKKTKPRQVLERLENLGQISSNSKAVRGKAEASMSLFLFCLLCKLYRFHVTLGLFTCLIDHRRRQNLVKTSVTHCLACGSVQLSAAFLFLPHFDVIWNYWTSAPRTATWNLFVK